MSDSIGFGVMINMLFDDQSETRKTIEKYRGQEIKTVQITEDRLMFTFESGKMSIWDNGQSCCEYRYMHTDDPLDYFAGSIFMDAKIADGPTERSEYGEHIESQFLIITTSKGAFTVVNYNEHNGYYGGFWLVAEDLGLDI